MLSHPCLLHESGHPHEDIWAIGTGLMSAGFLYKISLEPLMVSTMLQVLEDFFDLGQVLINRNTQVKFKQYYLVCGILKAPASLLKEIVKLCCKSNFE